MAAPLVKRLQVRPGQTVLALNAPKDHAQRVSQVAVDDTWSALRFKAIADAGRSGERGAGR